MNEEEKNMNSMEFFDLIKKEWCRGVEQEKPFWHDVITFARKYYKEITEYKERQNTNGE